jgi:hypothetical protein
MREATQIEGELKLSFFASGYAQQFLSARFWIPLSRLTYSVYLVHVIVQQFMFNATNGSLHYSFSLVVSMTSREILIGIKIGKNGVKNPGGVLTKDPSLLLPRKEQ